MDKPAAKENEVWKKMDPSWTLPIVNIIVGTITKGLFAGVNGAVGCDHNSFAVTITFNNFFQNAQAVNVTS